MGLYLFLRQFFRRSLRAKDISMDRAIKEYLQVISSSPYFETIITYVLIIDAIYTGLVVSKGKLKASFTFLTINRIFIGLYILEFCIKISASCKNFWKLRLNCFDFIFLLLLLPSLFEPLFMWNITLLYIVRQMAVMRFLRLLRIANYVGGLELLINVLVDTTVVYACGILLLVSLFMYIFATVGYNLFGKSDNEMTDTEYWGSLAKTFYPIFSMVVANGWVFFIHRLDEIHLSTLSRIYAALVILTLNFVLIPTLLAIVINSIRNIKMRQQELEKQRKTKKLYEKYEKLQQCSIDNVQQMFTKQEISKKTFDELIRDISSSLKHTELVPWKDPCGWPLWINILCTTMDHQDNVSFRLHQLHYELGAIMLKNLENFQRRSDV